MIRKPSSIPHRGRHVRKDQMVGGQSSSWFSSTTSSGFSTNTYTKKLPDKKRRRRRQRIGPVAAIRRSTRQRDENPNCLILGSWHVLSHIFLCALFLFFVVFIKPIQQFLIPYLLRVGGMEEALEDVSNEVSNSLHEISCRDIDFTCI